MGVRLSSRGYNPMTAAGQLLYGGSGSVTGFGDNVALNSLGIGVITSGVSGDAQASVFDGSDATRAVVFNSAISVGMYVGCQLVDPERIGRFRFVQGTQDPGGRATAWAIESADAAAGPWTSRYEHDAIVETDYGLIDLDAPATAIYWRVVNRVTTTVNWGIDTLELYPVTTVGAGNLEALESPSAKRHLVYDPANAVPAWEAPGATIADVAASVGIAVNDAGATLVPTRTEHEAVRAALNTLLARLEAAGILASS